MSTTLSTTTIGSGSSGPPTLIIDSIGAKFRGAVVDIEARQEQEYLDKAKRDAGREPRPVWWENRMPTPVAAESAQARGLQPVMYDVITYLVIKASDGVFIGDEETPEPGQLVNLHAHGPRGRGWRDAAKAMGRQPVVGDIHLITFESEDEASGAKTITFKVEDADADIIAKAEAARSEKLTQGATPVATTAAPTPAAPGFDDDPF